MILIQHQNIHYGTLQTMIIIFINIYDINHKTKMNLFFHSRYVYSRDMHTQIKM